MIEILTSLLDIIVSLVTFVINTIMSLIALISTIPQQVAFLTSAINTLPNFVLPYATAFISINVILFIVGRKSGST